jgi:hypothetical protein
MTGSEDQGLLNVSDVNQRAPTNLYRPGPARSSLADPLHLDQCGGDEWRYRRGGTEPALDEVFREPVVRLMMKCDNVLEDELLRCITIACRHLNGMHVPRGRHDAAP